MRTASNRRGCCYDARSTSSLTTARAARAAAAAERAGLRATGEPNGVRCAAHSPYRSKCRKRSAGDSGAWSVHNGGISVAAIKSVVGKQNAGV